jgi:3-oxoacyl-[acyl-carrier protein] reductase
MRLQDKVAIITGAASGIGAASAERFVAEGAHVVVADRDADAAEAVAARLGERAKAAAVDVTDAGAVKLLVDEVCDQHGRVDVLFSNAGIPEQVKPLADITREEWDLLLDVNLTAAFTLTQAVAPVMRDQGGGSIVVTASIAANRPRPGMAAYVASKAGVIGLAKALAIELAPDGIRVNVINPGPANTPMLEQFGFDADVAAALPLGVAIEGDDIAAAAVYLASDEARKVTGLVMNVDSGRDL